MQQHQLQTAHHAAARLGWTPDFTAAEVSDKGGTSGGVGVMVRSRYTLRRFDFDHEAINVPYAHRQGCWLAEGGVPAAIVLASMYLRTGEEDSETNMNLFFGPEGNRQALHPGSRLAADPGNLGGDKMASRRQWPHRASGQANLRFLVGCQGDRLLRHCLAASHLAAAYGA